jgi:hypothetical protein
MGEEVNASQHPSPQGNLTPDMIHGEYLVLSTGEGCGDARKALRACGPCPHPPL